MALADRDPTFDARRASVETNRARSTGRARVLILDDPTSGVDVGAKDEIYRLIIDQTRAGASVLMSSSELPELLAIANRTLVLFQGRVAGLLEGEEMTQRSILHLALRGPAAESSTTAQIEGQSGATSSDQEVTS